MRAFARDSGTFRNEPCFPLFNLLSIAVINLFCFSVVARKAKKAKYGDCPNPGILSDWDVKQQPDRRGKQKGFSSLSASSLIIASFLIKNACAAIQANARKHAARNQRLQTAGRRCIQLTHLAIPQISLTQEGPITLFNGYTVIQR